MNIGDEYMGLDKRRSPWRDTHLRITGTAVRFLQERFLNDWYYATEEKEITEGAMLHKYFPASQAAGNIGMQVVSSGPDTIGEQNKRGLIKMVNSARESICIQSPYFVPDDSFLESLQIAAMSGVDVQVMLPAVPDKRFVYRVTTSYIKDLMDYGIKVSLYPGFLYAKMIVMDGKITSIGTTNIDIRSFILDFEVNTFIYNTQFSRKCVDIFNKDMEISRLVTEEWYESRSLWLRIQERVFRLFSPIL
jgi:cardiolipin synthase